MRLRQRRQRAYAKRGFGWGKRCPGYFAGCILCEAWMLYDRHGRWPTCDEASKAADQAAKGVDFKPMSFGELAK